jgi:hypothetical protein
MKESNRLRWSKGTPSIGDRFAILGGDGNQDFLQERQTLILIEADWFPGKTYMSMGSPALLFRIDGGRWHGRFLAISSRVITSLDKQFEIDGNASCILQLIENPTATFTTDTERDIDALAMAVVGRLQ